MRPLASLIGAFRRRLVRFRNEDRFCSGRIDVLDRRPYFERRTASPDPPVWLRGLAAVYGAGLKVDRVLRPRPPGRGERPWVIGIGNLEAGGTGKTPTVIALARAALAAGWNTAVLTRGHGGPLGRREPAVLDAVRVRSAPDEARLLWEAIGDRLTIVLSRNKSRGLEFLRRNRDLELILVDDAFQTVGLEVDRHLVLLDWTKPLGNGSLLPAGRLREGPDSLRRAHAVLFTRAHGPEVPRNPQWSHLNPDMCFLARETAVGLRSPDGAPIDPAGLRGCGTALLSGLGRPEAFEALSSEWAEKHGFEVRFSLRVGDHGDLSDALARLSRDLPDLGCQYIITTCKDLQRLTSEQKKNEPLLALEQRLDIESLPELLALLKPTYLESSAQLAKVTSKEP